MTEVDYSQYYYNRGIKREEEPKRKKPKRKKKTLAFLIMTAITVAVFFVVNYCFDGTPYNEVRAFFTGKGKAEFYLLEESVTSRDKAYARALAVRQGGGGGYVYDDDGYLVVYSAYREKTEANAVRDKQSGTDVRKITMWEQDEKIFSLTVTCLTNLISASEELELGTLHETEFSELCMELSSRIIFLEQTLYGEGYEQEDFLGLNVILVAIDNAKLMTVTRAEQLARIRYAVISVILRDDLNKKS